MRDILTAKKVQEWAYGHKIHRSYHILHHPEVAVLVEHYGGLLKTQLKHQLIDNSLQKWVLFLQKRINKSRSEVPLISTHVSGN